LPIAYVHNQSMFFNIWLESQMIHVALFSFQRTTCCLSKLSLQATLLSYRIPSGLSRTFFLLPLRVPQDLCQSRLPGICFRRISQRLVL
ncbi:hypothetical protein, partial [Mitsuokella sp.]|uniref:hypothetical protein n=1 Tax=Mitsuokella sp. TaxID=2049034 RepID=UPI002A83F1D9